MDFNGIIGQKEIVGSLKRSLANGRVGHAYIFGGPPGIGKRTIAGIFAGFLLCNAPGPDSTCGVCQACLLYEGGTNPDINRVRLTESSIGVDKIRDIQGDVSIKPMYSRKKVYIIEDAEKMTVQAQNCLLKTLEEPPPYVVLILAVSNHEALLETIRSRAQRLYFRKNTAGQVRQAVEARFGKDRPEDDIAVDYADGVIGTALELAGSGDFAALREKTIRMASGLAQIKLPDIFSLTPFFEDNRQHIDILLDIMLLFYRDLLVVKKTGNENMLINPDKKDIILNNVRKYSLQRLIAAIGQVEAARRAIKLNVNFQLVIENMLIKLQEVI